MPANRPALFQLIVSGGTPYRSVSYTSPAGDVSPSARATIQAAIETLK
jgi:hypothetical protein